MTDASDLDAAEAHNRIARAVSGLSVWVPDLIESPGGARRIYWPGDKRRDDPALFSR